MHTRNSAVSTIVLATLLSFNLTAQAQSKDPTRPNIIFIFTDDHSTAAIGTYGSVINQTPQLDRLASQGMVFENTFCSNSICAPSRAVILTGKHSHINGVTDNAKTFDGSQVTFPKLLQKAGYQTAMIGKWHLKTDPTGFDYWDILPGQGQYYNPDFISSAGKRRVQGYVTDITTDLAINWLENQRDQEKPFMLMAQHKAPHRSWMPGPDHLNLYENETIPEPATLFDDYESRGSAAHEQEMSIENHMYIEYDLKCPPAPDDTTKKQGPDRWAANVFKRMSLEQVAAWDAAYGPRNEAYYKENPQGQDLVSWKYQRYIKDYLRCIASVDDNVGRLLDYLDESGLSENTIVIYSSDQGFFLGEHGWYDKRFMYEPALRMPFIVRWPGQTAPGTRDTHLVQNIDFGPTFLDLAGVEIPAAMQGKSIVPILQGNAPQDWRKSIYYEYFELTTHHVAHHYGVRTDRFKLIHFPATDEWEFYDLQTDPDEIHNTYDTDKTNAPLIATLKQELIRLRKYYKVPDADG